MDVKGGKRSRKLRWLLGFWLEWPRMVVPLTSRRTPDKGWVGEGGGAVQL